MLPDVLAKQPTVAALEAWDASAILDGKYDRSELTLVIEPERIADVCCFLKKERQYNRLAAVTAVDWWPAEPRFEVVYLLHSLPLNERLRLKCRLPGDAAQIETVCRVWKAADWYEREVFDLFGIRFRNHPNLTRIMMPEGWQGHPLRKDYPTAGRYSYQGEAIS